MSTINTNNNALFAFTEISLHYNKLYALLKPTQKTHRRRSKNAIQSGDRHVQLAVLNVLKSSSLDAAYRKVRWREVR